MIGVIAVEADREVVKEFFELFKTPWEFYHKDQEYDVLLSAGDDQIEATAKVVLVYAGRETHFDDLQGIKTGFESKRPCILTSRGRRIPIYGNTITFPGKVNCLLAIEDSKECAAYLSEAEGRVVARIGYDLLGEIRSLLTLGQPADNANLPTLELHIALLRDLITGCGVPLVEIPPIPDGFQFVACLTHDVDHPSLRQHRWDHTMFGFLYRAVFGSMRRFIRGKMPAQDLLRNWGAALKLPLVHLGLAKDFWRDFADRYSELENGLGSTFFVIPFKNYAGKRANGLAPEFRASRYGAHDIADMIRVKGREELEEIRRLTRVSDIGVRMHWLYYDQKSPAVLEEGGAAYDSTVGYNETVGYRAGTTQPYKPLGLSHLLELPMHVMDTALFYPTYLELSPQQTRTILRKMVDNALQFGGVLTTNWHDRSLLPERLWDASYRKLLQDMKDRGAWFATAGQAVSWFRKRRSAAFVTDPIAPCAVRVKVKFRHDGSLPGLRLRIHNAGDPTPTGASDHYIDVEVEDADNTSVPSVVRR
jgi:hypothetical protein